MSMARSPDDGRRNCEQFVDFVLHMARLLIACGCSANRVELLNAKLGEAFGFTIQTMALPTGVWVSVRQGGVRCTELIRIPEWSVDLDRLDAINQLVNEIGNQKLSLSEAQRQLNAIAARPKPYAFWMTALAGGGASGVLVYLYHGTWMEIGLAVPAGIAVQIIDVKFLKHGEKRFLLDFLSAAFVALYVCLMQRWIGGLDVPRMIVGGIIALIPGLVMVNSVHEIAQKNLVSGSAKLLEALTIIASLGAGVFFVIAVLGF